MNIQAYIAGPMRGMPEANFPAFNQVASSLRRLGWEVFNPCDDEVPNDPDIRKLLIKDTAWICEFANAIVLLPGWESSRGARMEVALAYAIGGIKVWYVERALDKLVCDTGEEIKI